MSVHQNGMIPVSFKSQELSISTPLYRNEIIKDSSTTTFTLEKENDREENEKRNGFY